jgi:hypothetical protein
VDRGADGQDGKGPRHLTEGGLAIASIASTRSLSDAAARFGTIDPTGSSVRAPRQSDGALWEGSTSNGDGFRLWLTGPPHGQLRGMILPLGSPIWIPAAALSWDENEGRISFTQPARSGMPERIFEGVLGDNGLRGTIRTQSTSETWQAAEVMLAGTWHSNTWVGEVAFSRRRADGTWTGKALIPGPWPTWQSIDVITWDGTNLEWRLGDLISSVSFSGTVVGRSMDGTLKWINQPGAWTGSIAGQSAMHAIRRDDGVLRLPSWIIDDVPTGAKIFGAGENWTWINQDPVPFSGLRAHQSALVSGMHQHYFEASTETLAIAPGERLYAYVNLDPLNPPTTVMLQWNDGTWEHRAFWGSDSIPWGSTGTASRRPIGPLPTLGQWARLEVPAALVDLEGKTINGMAFTLNDGRATWDMAGKVAP